MRGPNPSWAMSPGAASPDAVDPARSVRLEASWRARVGAYLLRDRPGRFMTVLGCAPIVQAAVIALVSLRPPLPVAIAVLQVSCVAEVIGQPGGFTLISYVVPARVRGLGMQTTVPWQLINLVMLPFLVAAMEGFGLQHGILLLVPFLVVGGLILATGGPGVERDIRAARAADEADVASRRTDEGGEGALLVCRDVEVEYDGVPVLFGVITADNMDQAVARSGEKADNKGYEAAMSAVEMATLLQGMKAFEQRTVQQTPEDFSNVA